jgi:lysozyme
MRSMEIKHSHFANGIDVSDNNGDFDWHSWDGHIDFAMIKATEGPMEKYPTGWRDTQFERNWAGAKAIGLHRFAYHFARPDHDPAMQAKYFVDTIREAGFDLEDSIVLDFETNIGINGPLSVADAAFWAYVWCCEVERLIGMHHRILIFTYPWFAEQGNCHMLRTWGLWVGNWDVPTPAVPPPWDRWYFWQYTAGAWGGTGIDLDRFNGNDHELEIFCTR